MTQRKQGNVSKRKLQGDYLPEVLLRLPLTEDEKYVLSCFRGLSETRQQAVKLVIGSMAIGDWAWPVPHHSGGWPPEEP